MNKNILVLIDHEVVIMWYIFRFEIYFWVGNG